VGRLRLESRDTLQHYLKFLVIGNHIESSRKAITWRRGEPIPKRTSASRSVARWTPGGRSPLLVKAGSGTRYLRLQNAPTSGFSQIGLPASAESIAPFPPSSKTPTAERSDYGQVVLAQRLRDALARLKPRLPAEALDDASRRLTRPEGPTLGPRSRALYRLPADGVTVEYRTPDGAIRGAQAHVIDFTGARSRRRGSWTSSRRRASPGPSSPSCPRSSWRR
jgi:hypothetical protein